MTAIQGSLFLLKASEGGTPENFITLGGIRATDMMLGNRAADASHVESGAWRQLLDNAGERAISISGDGLFTDAASEEAVRACAFAGSSLRFRLCFAHGGMLEGPFMVTHYHRGGSHDGEENYALRLESAGAVTYTAA